MLRSVSSSFGHATLHPAMERIHQNTHGLTFITKQRSERIDTSSNGAFAQVLQNSFCCGENLSVCRIIISEQRNKEKTRPAEIRKNEKNDLKRKENKTSVDRLDMTPSSSPSPPIPSPKWSAAPRRCGGVPRGAHTAEEKFLAACTQLQAPAVPRGAHTARRDGRTDARTHANADLINKSSDPRGPKAFYPQEGTPLLIDKSRPLNTAKQISPRGVG